MSDNRVKFTGGGGLPPPFKVRSTVFSRQPLLFLGASLGAGAYLGYAVHRAGIGLLPLFALVVLASAAACTLHRLRRGAWAALAGCTACLLAGMLMTALALPAWYGQWGENTGYTYVTGRVSARRHGQQADTLTLTSLSVMEDGHLRPLSGAVAITVADPDEDAMTEEETPPLPEGQWERPEEARAVRVGDRVTITGMKLKMPEESGIPGTFDQRLYWAAQGVRFTGYTTVDSVWMARGSGLARALDSFRLWLYGRMQADMGREGAGLAAALVMGWTADLAGARDDYANLGISHVLSVSGLHVSILIAAVGLVAKRRRWMRMQGYLAQGTLIAAYFLLAGVRPSFNRVLFMAILGLIAEQSGRESDAVNSLSAAFILQLLLSPLSVFTMACQLTYLATLALLLLRDIVPRHPVTGTVALAMGIAWAVLPYAGSSVYPLAAGLANGLLVPAYSVMVGACFLYLPVAPFTRIASLYGGIVGRLARGLGRMVAWASGVLPSLRLPFVAGWGFCAASGVLVLLASRRILGKKRAVRYLCFALATVMMAVSLAVAGWVQRPRVTVIGSGVETALYLQDMGEAALIGRSNVYGAGDVAEAGYRGRIDTVVFTGEELTELETILREQPGITRVVLRKETVDAMPGWYEAVARRYGVELAPVTAEAPLAIGGFTVMFLPEAGLRLLRGDWAMTYGGEARPGERFVVDRASWVNLRKAAGAAEIIYSDAYAGQGLDEPVINGYNNSRLGAWIKTWPRG